MRPTASDRPALRWVLGAGLERGADRLHPRLGVAYRLARKQIRRDPTMAVLEHLVGAGDVAVDVGANRGVYTWRLSRLVGPEGHVHAIEPFPPSVVVLHRLLRRRRNVTVHPLALSDRAAFAALHAPVVSGRPLDGLASLAPPGVEHVRVEVEVARLDDLLADRAADISFVKCDVEGHELAVLSGARRILERSRPVLLVEIEERHAGKEVHRTFDLLAELGYTGHSLHDNGLRPLDPLDRPQGQGRSGAAPFQLRLPAGYVNNFLFTPPDADVSALLASGRRERT